MNDQRFYYYPVWVRIWHWINVILFLMLLATGISMQYANPQQPLLISFEVAVKYHNIAGVCISINYLLFILGNLFTANGNYYRTDPRGLIHRITRQAYFYTVGMFKKDPPPFPLTHREKFNPLQKISYIFTMYLGYPIIIISGWAMLFPEIIPHKLLGVSGLLLTDLIHVIMGFVLSMFMFIHIYVCTIGDTLYSNIKSMITGWH